MEDKLKVVIAEHTIHVLMSVLNKKEPYDVVALSNATISTIQEIIKQEAKNDDQL